MSAWAPKRFWSAATALACEGGGFTVHLDNRAVKTPAKRPLIVPTLAMAQAMAAEWDAQTGLIRPETMPITRFANSALEKVTPNVAAVVDELAGYGATDLLCYRAEGPMELVQRQAAAWDSWLTWAARDLAAPLTFVHGVMFVQQPKESLANLRAHVAAHGAFELAGLHDLVAISGSLILALAMARGAMDAEQGFALSRVDETWQAEKWGEDAEAAALESAKAIALRDALHFFRLCTS